MIFLFIGRVIFVVLLVLRWTNTIKNVKLVTGWILKSRGLGIMSETLSEIIRFCFKELNMDNINASVLSYNCESSYVS